MKTRAENLTLVWDFPIPQSLAGSGQWVLGAMKNHGPQLVTMLWRILGNEEDVCDAYQTTFLNLAHFDGGKPENVKSYLFRTASNAAISMLRRRMIERKHLAAFSIENAERHSFGDLDSGIMISRLRECIAKLPDNLREIVILRDIAELSYEQTAEVMQIGVDTARVYRCKAVKLLAEWMKGKEELK